LTDGFSNDSLDSGAVGKFFYNGGQFQSLAVQLNLGADNNAVLHDHIAAQIGTDFSFTYDSPQLAAGVMTTATDYAFFLRKIINNQLLIGSMLGSHAVCTNPAICPNEALSTPIPNSENWHYSLGHWVEDDPTAGDGSFSSPGAFGFYPWIDASKTYYGILARYATPTVIGDSVAADSIDCGRRIRKAWMTGAQQ
jgi:CubicO group peptidase (beta-lactamase class C family)